MDGFFARVYELVARIPPGKVATYGQLASLLGHPLAARTVGWAMHSAPGDLDLPCHRVISKTGKLAPSYVFGGSEVQRAELEAEGVVFLDDGRVDMQECMWSPDLKREVSLEEALTEEVSIE